MERLVAAPIIRPGRPDDLGALERIEQAAFDADRLSRRSLRYFLAASATTDVLIADDGSPVGYAMIGFRAGSGVARLFSLAVLETVARRGLGRDLLRGCEAAARHRGRSRIRLEVRTDNRAAIGLYESEGYLRFAEIADYYEDGASALRFDKAIGPADAAAGVFGRIR